MTERLGATAEADALSDLFSTDRDRGGTPSESERPAREYHRADGGRFAPKPEAEAAPETPAAEVAQPEPTAPEETAPQTQNGKLLSQPVPLAELKKEREKRQEYQAQLETFRAEAEKRDAEYRRQLDELKRSLAAPKAPPPPPPDPLTDPVGAHQHQQQQVQSYLLNERLNLSEMLTREKLGDELVDAAVQWAEQTGEVARFIGHRNPYGELVKAYKRHQAVTEIGDDPAAYRGKLEQELREKILAELKGGGAAAVKGPTAPAQTRFPTSLAAETSAGAGTGSVLTPEAAMKDVFGHSRKRG
jgi:hypothetical protein